MTIVAEPGMAGDRLLTIAEVERRIGASHQAIYRWMNAGEFPRPIRIGTRRVRWHADEVERWVRSRVTAGQPVEPWIKGRHKPDKPTGAAAVALWLPDRVRSALCREARKRDGASMAGIAVRLLAGTCWTRARKRSAGTRTSGRSGLGRTRRMPTRRRPNGTGADSCGARPMTGRTMER